jgi:hypothetical protein
MTKHTVPGSTIFVSVTCCLATAIVSPLAYLPLPSIDCLFHNINNGQVKFKHGFENPSGKILYQI